MRISIITVNFNNPEGLERTIKSVLCQTCKNYEYIVVDGASTKGDIEVIHRYQTGITKWLSERDTGIYNAMNKGIRMASGDYCLFMNSGDEIYSQTTIEEITKLNLTEDFIQGIIARPRKKEQLISPPQKKDLTLGWYVWGNNNYHQASLIKRTMLLEHPYDENLRFSSDMKFNVECLIKNTCSYRTINVIIARYEYGGVSVTQNHKDEDLQLFIDLFGERIITDYLNQAYTHLFPIKYMTTFLRRLSENKFVKAMKKRNKFKR